MIMSSNSISLLSSMNGNLGNHNYFFALWCFEISLQSYFLLGLYDQQEQTQLVVGSNTTGGDSRIGGMLDLLQNGAWSTVFSHTLNETFSFSVFFSIVSFPWVILRAKCCCHTLMISLATISAACFLASKFLMNCQEPR